MQNRIRKTLKGYRQLPEQRENQDIDNHIKNKLAPLLQFYEYDSEEDILQIHLRIKEACKDLPDTYGPLVKGLFNIFLTRCIELQKVIQQLPPIEEIRQAITDLKQINKSEELKGKSVEEKYQYIKENHENLYSFIKKRDKVRVALNNLNKSIESLDSILEAPELKASKSSHFLPRLAGGIVGALIGGAIGTAIALLTGGFGFLAIPAGAGVGWIFGSFALGYKANANEKHRRNKHLDFITNTKNTFCRIMQESLESAKNGFDKKQLMLSIPEESNHFPVRRLA